MYQVERRLRTAEIRKAPWGRTARQVEEILAHSRPYGVAEAMEYVITRARARRAAEEHDVVATEVQRAIAQSGMSRAQLATRLGTSASRLSTYATGKVTPSATFMVRLCHVLGWLTDPTDPRPPDDVAVPKSAEATVPKSFACTLGDVKRYRFCTSRLTGRGLGRCH